MAVERQWNRGPGWMTSLPPATQAMLLADMHLALETPDQAKKAKHRAKRSRMDDHQDQYLKAHGHHS